MRGRRPDQGDVPLDVPDLAGSAGSAEPTARRRWPGRLGVAVVVALVALPIGLQVRLRTARAETARAEAAERAGLADVRTAAEALRTVDTRARAAEDAEDAAQAELDRTRRVMSGVGLDQATLEDVQAETGALRDAYRSQYDGEEDAIAVQERVEPAAGTCVLDRVRVLARIALGNEPGAPSEACTTVAGARPAGR